MVAGRPLLYQTVDELQTRIDEYFASCWSLDKDGVQWQSKPYLITALALHLGMSRKMLIEYEGREEFSNAITIARTRVEAYAEEIMLTGKNQAGAIFALKNYGWKDERHVEVNDITRRSGDELTNRAADLLGKIGVGGVAGGNIPPAATEEN